MLLASLEPLVKLDVEHLLLPVLVQLVVIIAAARAFGAIARRVGQPSVVGEIAAGVLLGPSLFGWLCPELFAAVFRPNSRVSSNRSRTLCCRRCSRSSRSSG